MLFTQCCQNVSGRMFNGLVAFHQLEIAEFLVEVLERLCLGVEHLESVLDRLRRIVLADGKRSAAQIADAVNLRRVRSDVITSSAISMDTTASKWMPAASSASACGIVRGTPSRMKPFAQSARATRSRTMPMMTSSGTSLPASMKLLAFRPVSVPFLIASRRMLPVEMVGMFSFLLMISACVPFPAPGAPKRISFIASSSNYSRKPL